MTTSPCRTTAWSGIRGGSNPEITNFKVNEIINDLTRDQTAAQNIVNTLGVVSDVLCVIGTL